MMHVSRTFYAIVTSKGTTCEMRDTPADAWAWIDTQGDRRGELHVERVTITERREDVPRPAKLKLVGRAA